MGRTETRVNIHTKSSLLEEDKTYGLSGDEFEPSHYDHPGSARERLKQLVGPLCDEDLKSEFKLNIFGNAAAAKAAEQQVNMLTELSTSMGGQQFLKPQVTFLSSAEQVLQIIDLLSVEAG